MALAWLAIQSEDQLSAIEAAREEAMKTPAQKRLDRAAGAIAAFEASRPLPSGSEPQPEI